MEEQSKLTPQQVAHIAHLARLELTENELDKMGGQLTSILDFVAILEEVDTAGVKPTNQVSNVTSVTRKDEVQGSDTEVRERIIKAFPNKSDNLCKVKGVFE